MYEFARWLAGVSLPFVVAFFAIRAMLMMIDED